MEIELLLRRLGANGTLKGFHYAIYMIQQVIQEPDAATRITKCLYPDTAKHFHVSPGTVEHNLRILVRVCWERSAHQFLQEVAGVELERRPTNSEFLDMTAAYLRRQAGA